MGKHEKEVGIPSRGDQRRTSAPPQPIGKVGKGRGRNFEAADAALRDKIAAGRQYMHAYLPEVEGDRKRQWRELRKLICVCGHRGDKHFRTTFFRRDIEPEPCRVCRSNDCRGFRAAPGKQP